MSMILIKKVDVRFVERWNQRENVKQKEARPLYFFEEKNHLQTILAVKFFIDVCWKTSDLYCAFKHKQIMANAAAVIEWKCSRDSDYTFFSVYLPFILCFSDKKSTYWPWFDLHLIICDVRNSLELLANSVSAIVKIDNLLFQYF